MLHAARSGDFGPLIVYALAVVLLLGLTLDIGGVNSQIEKRLKSGPLQHHYRWMPSWMFRYGISLGGLAIITAGLLVLA